MRDGGVWALAAARFGVCFTAMKSYKLSLCILGALLATSAWAEPEGAAEGAAKPAVDPTKPLPKSAKAPRKLEGGWTLVWHDEFNGSRLDKKMWRCEEGIVRNKGASQAYVDSCVKVKDGVLQLISKAAPTPNPNFGKKGGVAPWDAATKTQPYASGSVTTKGIMSFSPPGRLEFRARIPKAKGVWPAIWTMHENKYRWPANGEIDILEHISSEPDRVYSIFRWGENGGSNEFKVTRSTVIPDYSKEFHTYVLEWDNEMMRVLIDDKEVGRIKMSEAVYPNGDNPLQSPCYIIMNTAIGGTGTWAPKADDPSQYPVVFEIDYARYYTRKEAADDAAASGKKTPKKGAKPEAEGDSGGLSPTPGKKPKRQKK